MKEPEISQSLPSSPRVLRGPRYRYYSNPPVTVSLQLADLAPQIPEAARLPGFDAEHRVELSCEEILTGPVPKLSLSRLAEIASEHVRINGLADIPISLPLAQLALAYKFINGRELIEEEPLPDAVKPGLDRSSEEFSPKAGEAKEGQPAGEAEKPLAPPDERIAVDKGSVVAPPVAVPTAAPPQADVVTKPGDANSSPVEDGKTDAPSQSPDASPGKEPTSQAISEGGANEEAKPSEPEEWRPITVFPIFRRKVVEPQVKPPIAPLRPVVEARTPRAPFVPPEFSAKPAQEPKSESAEASVKEPAVPASQSEAVLIEAEHLSESEPKRPGEIVDQDALQAVFMTEEALSVDRVVELCGGLPGIKSCVLAHGPAVLASHNVPESIDLVSLSAHALEMLTAMRQSAARMGVGAVPAVTIHAEKGPITFFHQDDLCLLVMHKDRGFVPGVREKLQKVVEHLAQLNPALSAERSRLASASKKPST